MMAYQWRTDSTYEWPTVHDASCNDAEMPFTLGDEPAPNDHFQAQTGASLCYVSCTVRVAQKIGAGHWKHTQLPI